MTASRQGRRVLAAQPSPAVRRPFNQFLRALPAADFESLRPHMRSIELVRETVLVEGGAPWTHVYLPERGIVSTVVRLPGGPTIELAMTGRDGIVDASAAFDDKICSSDVLVLHPGSAVVLDLAHLHAAADRRTALRALLARDQQALFVQAQQSAASNASHSVEARVAHWLLRAHELCDGQALPLTQEMLAEMIGVQRNAVSLVAHALQQAGVISYRRGHIDINDLEGLAETACECHRVVDTQRHRLLAAANSPSNHHG